MERGATVLCSCASFHIFFSNFLFDESLQVSDITLGSAPPVACRANDFAVAIHQKHRRESADSVFFRQFLILFLYGMPRGKSIFTRIRFPAA